MTVVDLGTEKRIKAANDNRDASRWTTRDVLVDTLRAIDAGEIDTDTLIVTWIEDGPDTIRPRMVVAGPPRPFVRIAYLVEALKQLVWNPDG